MNEQYDWNLWFCSVVTENSQKRRLLSRYGTTERLFHADEKEIFNIEEITSEMKHHLLETRYERYIEKVKNALRRSNSSFVWWEDSKFPKELKDIDDAPFGLFYRGNIPKRTPRIAIVGTRASSSYGGETARLFATVLSKAGIGIVSGLAMGIDGQAHRSCLESGGVPIAVLGSGIDVPYPKENWDLYQQVCENGCIISEYPPGTPALKYHFPHRNRLISGLSDGVLVVEARERSGTLITVDRALEQGKEVYVIPGRITDRNSIGCIHLIQQGAKVVCKPEEILTDICEMFGSEIVKMEENGQYYLSTMINHDMKNKKIPLASDEKIVYAFLRLGPKQFDSLVWETGIHPQKLNSILYSMEKKQWIYKSGTQQYSAVAEDSEP